MKKISILITENHALLCEAWCYLLNADPRFEVVASCDTAELALQLVQKYSPDVIVMDINLTGTDGIEATEKILQISPGTHVLGVSAHTHPEYARKIMKKGAKGYVSKSTSLKELINAIVTVYNGNKYICTTIKNELVEQMWNGNKKGTGVNSLSQRETEIIDFIKKGYSSKEIASFLFLSAKTIEVHRYNILRKLNLKNAAALVNFAYKNAVC